MAEKREPGPKRGAERVQYFAKRAIEALRSDAPKEFATLVKQYDGQAAVIGLLGVGSTSIVVKGGKVQVGENVGDRVQLLARAAAHPETVVAIADGQITPIEAYHTGDIVVRPGRSEELHRAFGFIVQMTEPVLRSKGLQDLLREFRSEMGVQGGRPDSKDRPLRR